MPDPKFTVAEFAQKIKKKRPEYSKYSDREAVDRYLEFFPGYQNYLTDYVKKKEVSEPTGSDLSEQSSTGDALKLSYNPGQQNPFNPKAIDRNPYDDGNQLTGIGSDFQQGGATLNTSFHNQLYGFKQGYGAPEAPKPKQKLDMAKVIKGMDAYQKGKLKDLPDFGHPELSQAWQKAHAEAPNNGFLANGLKATMDFAGDLFPGISRAWDKGSIQGDKANILGTGRELTEADINELARLERREQELGATEEEKAYAEGGWGWILDNPGPGARMIRNTIISSMASQLKASETTTLPAVGIGASLGAVLPGIGSAFGAVAGLTTGQMLAGFNLETASAIMETLKEAGYNTRDENELAKAFNNKDIQDKAYSLAIKRGIPILALDLATAGVVGKIAKAAKPLKGLRKIGASAGTLGVEAAGGGLGELAAQVVSGQGIDLGEVAMETVAEAGSGGPSLVGETAMGTMELKKRKKTSASNDHIATQFAYDPETAAKEAPANLTRLLEQGTISEEEHAEGMKFLEAAKEASDKVPADAKPEDKAAFIEVLAEKVETQKLIGELTDAKAQLDEAFHAAIDQKLGRARKKEEALTQKLKDLIKERKQLPAHEETQTPNDVPIEEQIEQLEVQQPVVTTEPAQAAGVVYAPEEAAPAPVAEAPVVEAPAVETPVAETKPPVEKHFEFNNGYKVSLKVNEGEVAKIVEPIEGNLLHMGMHGRIFANVRVGDTTIPMYMSSEGTSGKKKGQWYPFFGIAPGGWIIKGGVDEMENGYGIPEIQEAQRILNENVQLDTGEMKLLNNDGEIKLQGSGNKIFDLKEHVSFTPYRPGLWTEMDQDVVQRLNLPQVDLTGATNGREVFSRAFNAWKNKFDSSKPQTESATPTAPAAENPTPAEPVTTEPVIETTAAEPKPQYAPGLSKVTKDHYHYETDGYSVDMEAKYDPEAEETAWHTTIIDKKTGQPLSQEEVVKREIEPTESLEDAKFQLAGFLGLEKLPTGKPGKGVKVTVYGKDYTIHLHERPSKQYPVYSVQINGKTHYIQRSDGTTPGMAAWYEVVKDDRFDWTGLKQAQSETQQHFSHEHILGYTQTDAVYDLIDQYAPENKPAKPSLAGRIFNDQEAVKPVLDFLENMKIKSNGANVVIAPVAQAWNLAISTVQAGIKTGNSLKNAIKIAVNATVEYLKENNGFTHGDALKEVKEYEKRIVDSFREQAKTDPAAKKLVDDYDHPKTIKQRIKEATDSRSRDKIVRTELQLMKKQMEDWTRGYRQGVLEAKKIAKEQYEEDQRQIASDFQEFAAQKDAKHKERMAQVKAKYEEKIEELKIKAREKEQVLQAMRQELIDMIDHIKDSGLFTGKDTKQNRLLNVSKKFMEAGSKPVALSRAIDYAINTFADLDYRNKIDEAQTSRERLDKMFFKGVSKVVDDFLKIEPQDLSLDELYEYIHIQEDLISRNKAKEDAGTVMTEYYTPAEFDYIRDFTTEVNAALSTEVVELDPELHMTLPATPFEKDSLWYEIKTGAKKLMNNWLDFRKGMPKGVYKLYEAMQGHIAAAVTKAEAQAKVLEKMLKQNPELVDTVDAALRGDQEKLNELPERMMIAVMKMRQHIDKLSQSLIDNGYLQSWQAKEVELNLGTYLNRSYELFKNNEWNLDNVPQPLVNRAKEFLYNKFYRDYKYEHRNDPPATLKSEEEIKRIVGKQAELKIKEYFDKDKNEYWKGKKIGAKDLSILTERHNIDEPLRALFGEIKDPIYNYINTVYKLANLDESNRFLHNVRENFLGKFFFEEDDPNRPANAFKKIAAEGTETFAPLNGLYVTEEIYNAFKTDRVDLPEPLRLLAQIAGIVRVGKTVYSPITHIKNVEGNLGIIVSNGMAPWGKISEAWKAVQDDLKNQDTKALEEIILPLTEANLLKQSVSANQMKLLFSDTHPSDVAYQRRFGRERTPIEKIEARMHELHDKVSGAYTAEDDFFKIFAYLKDRDRYADALYGKKPSELTPEESAAVNDHVIEILKNTIPNFSRVPRIARAGGMILGNFVSFASEAFRTEWNQWEQMIKEVASDNPKLRMIGAQRLAGIVAWKGFKLGLMALGKGAIGGLIGMITDDDEDKQRMEDIRRTMPYFSKNSDLLILSLEKRKLRYIDLSSYDPQGNRIRAFRALMRGENMAQAFGNAIVEGLSPFTDPEITTATIRMIDNNEDAYGRPIYNPEDDWIIQAGDISAFASKQLEPGISGFARKMMDKEVTAGNKALSLLVKVNEKDLDLEGRYMFLRYSQRLDNIEKIYNSEKFKKDTTPEKTAAAFSRSNRKVDELVLEMHKDYMALIRLGVSPDYMEKQFKSLKFRTEMKKAIRTGNPGDMGVKWRPR